MDSPSAQLEANHTRTMPKYHELMLPLLELCRDGNEHTTREAAGHLAKQFELSQNQLVEMLPSGQQTVFDNRIGWARTYLAKAGLLEKIGRGRFKITSRGREFLKTIACSAGLDAEYGSRF
jgi:restriction system protein